MDYNKMYNKIFPSFRDEKVAEAQKAYDEYKKRDCGEKVYNGDTTCKRAMYAIFNAYLDYLCFTRGAKVASNHRRYIKRGKRERKDELNIIINDFNLS